MSSLVKQTRQLERVIRRKEKIFLMEQYAASMLEQLEPTAAETEADAQVLDALRIAYRYVNPTLGARLSDLLVAYGYTGDLDADREAAEEAESATFEEEEEEEEQGKSAPAKSKKGKGSGGGADSADGADEDEEAGVLFERDIYTGRKTKKKSEHSAADGEDAADLFAEGSEEGEEGDAADLFADEEEDGETGPGAARKGKAKHRRSASGDADDEGDPADLFADDDGADETDDSGPETASKGKTKARNASSADDEDDPADLFAEEDEHTSGGADDLFAGEDAGEEEDPKAAKKKKAKGRSADSDTDDEGDPADLFADDGTEEADDTPAKAKKTKGRKASQDDGEEHDADGEGSADDLFAEDDTEEGDDTPTKGKKTKTRQAGAAADGDEEDAADLFEEDDEDAGALFEQDIYTSEKKKKKKKKRRAEDGEEEPDLVVDEAEDKESRQAPKKKGRERRETPGFAAPEGAVERDERNRQGFAPVNVNLEAEEALESRSKVRKRPGAGRPGEEEEEEEEEETKTRKARPGARRAGEEEEEEEEEEPGNRRATKPKRDPRVAAEEEKEEKSKKQGREAQAADPKAEEKKLNLDALAFQVSVEDLRTHMGLSLVREDHVKLMRRWEQKSRDNSIRLLLDDPKASQHPYALIPRVTRFIKDGQIVQVNVLSLVRHFFQLFENVPQVVQLKSEPFFVTELPTLEWAVVACEALPDTLNKTVLEQRTVFGQYIQKFMSNERRVRRRVLVEALYDIIVLNMVCKEPILRKTVDLTETRRGRQQQMCVNFGAKGIRVSSIGRDQRHPQMGMCPSW